MNIARTLCLSALGVSLSVGSAAAEPTKQELLEALTEMNQRMEQVESRLDDSETELQAARDELDASATKVERQDALIEKAGIGLEAKSGLSSFYEQVTVSGWLAGSYFYNFNNPESETIGAQGFGGTNQGFNGGIIPFHPDHNSFSVDQLWIEIEKPISDESRAGFYADLVYGKTAGILGQPTNRSCGFGAANSGCGGDSASDFYLYQAYVQYQTPFGPTVKAGKFGTLIGYEVAPTVYNFNITRGNVYNLTQPITHYGVLLEGETDGGFLYALGVLNSDAGIDPDTNNSKTGIARVGYAADTWSAIANVIYGAEANGSDGGKMGRFNIIADWNPTEKFSGWVDFTFAWNEASVPVTATGNPSIWGIAVAGRYAFTDRLGFAMRAEYVADTNNFAGFTNSRGTVGVGDDFPVDMSIWSLTGTLDYELAENLTTKFEIRWDHASYPNANEFVNSRQERNAQGGAAFANAGNAFTNGDQVIGGIEVVYQF